MDDGEGDKWILTALWPGFQWPLFDCKCCCFPLAVKSIIGLGPWLLSSLIPKWFRKTKNYEHFIIWWLVNCMFTVKKAVYRPSWLGEGIDDDGDGVARCWWNNTDGCLIPWWWWLLTGDQKSPPIPFISPDSRAASDSIFLAKFDPLNFVIILGSKGFLTQYTLLNLREREERFKRSEGDARIL